MIGDGGIGGVYISPAATACLAALVATTALSATLTRLGFFRLVWHRPLVEVSIFCILFALAGLAPAVGIGL